MFLVVKNLGIRISVILMSSLSISFASGSGRGSEKVNHRGSGSEILLLHHKIPVRYCRKVFYLDDVVRFFKFWFLDLPFPVTKTPLLILFIPVGNFDILSRDKK